MSPCSTACCSKATPNDDVALIDVVNEAYSKMGRESADQAYAEHVASSFGYTSDQLQSVPPEAHLGLGCGNPVVVASIKEGETVLDLGCGGGIDVFLAAAKAGPTGQVIGLDNSHDMVARARHNAAGRNLRPPHVAFVKATLTEDLPIKSNSVDCVLSNCVINLLPPTGKVKLMREVYRVLKPGGRVSMDDIVAKKPFPDSLRSNMEAYVGCLSGAILLQDYRMLMQNAGFKDALFTESPADLNVYGSTGCCESVSASSETCSPTDIGDWNQWAASYHIYATKNAASAIANPARESALKNWWDAYPVPVSSPGNLECRDVAVLIQNPALGHRDFIVVDVRRHNRAGGRVRGSVHRPAQMFFDGLSNLYEEYKETTQVIFYCGSSRNSGPRCAQWYQDYLDQQGNATSKAFVMTGGAEKWMSSYREQEDLVDFDAEPRV